MAIVKKMSKRGFTLIELMIVVVIIGVLAALAIYGVQKYVANSKSAEARMMLGRMSKDHLAFFEGENQEYQVLAPGGVAGITRSLCPAAGVTSAAVPAGQKFQPEAATFKDNAGWECLKFSISTPIYYQYSMESPNQPGTMDGATALVAAADTHSFTAVAAGNLDADAVESRFELGGAVNEDADGNLALILATTVNEIEPEE